MNANQKEVAALQGELSRGEHFNSLQKKTEGTKRLKEVPFKKVAGLRLGITHFLRHGDCSTFNMEGYRHKKKVRHRFKDTSI